MDNLDALAPASPDAAPDIRAALVVKLLLQGCAPDTPAGTARPSLTHLLMGYDVDPSMAGLEDSVLLPRAEFSCLTIIERCILHQDGLLCRTRPKLFSHMLCVLHRLASSPASSVPMLEYLAPKNSGVVAALASTLYAPAPAPEKTHEVAAALHSASWVLRLHALLLLRLEHAESARALLTELLAPPAPDGALAPVGRCLLLELLSAVTAAAPVPPSLTDMAVEERRLAADMAVADVSVEGLLAHPHVQAGMGVLMRSDAGDVLFDVQALYPLLMQRWEWGREGHVVLSAVVLDALYQDFAVFWWGEDRDGRHGVGQAIRGGHGEDAQSI